MSPWVFGIHRREVFEQRSFDAVEKTGTILKDVPLEAAIVRRRDPHSQSSPFPQLVKILPGDPRKGDRGARGRVAVEPVQHLIVHGVPPIRRFHAQVGGTPDAARQ